MVVTNKKREKMARYDKLLKQFQHSKALDAAMEVSSFLLALSVASYAGVPFLRDFADFREK